MEGEKQVHFGLLKGYLWTGDSGIMLSLAGARHGTMESSPEVRGWFESPTR